MIFIAGLNLEGFAVNDYEEPIIVEVIHVDEDDAFTAF